MRHKKKMSKGKKVFIAIATMFLILLGIGSAYALNMKGKVDNTYKSTDQKRYRDASKAIDDKKPLSILLLGTDTGSLGRTDKGRTDSMMLVTINPKTKTTMLTSIPRDSMVSIIGHENTFPQKINAAYTFGDVDSSIDTVQTWLNVPVDFYALINMGGIKKLVNDIGGIDVVSPLTFDYEGTHFTEGKTEHLNGDRALKFSRMRYDDPNGDYGRQQRQRMVIQAILDKVKSNKEYMNANVVEDITENLRTNVKSDQILSLAKAYSAGLGTIKNDHLQGQGQEISGTDFEVVPQSEKQRVTNSIRKQLGLSHAKTGSLYAGKVAADPFGTDSETADDTTTAKSTKASTKKASNNLDDDASDTTDNLNSSSNSDDDDTTTENSTATIKDSRLIK